MIHSVKTVKKLKRKFVGIHFFKAVTNYIYSTEVQPRHNASICGSFINLLTSLFHWLFATLSLALASVLFRCFSLSSKEMLARFTGTTASFKYPSQK